MHKKLLMLLLVLIMVFSLYPASFAKEVSDNSEDSSFMLAQGTLNTLGVTFVTDDVNTPVTRGEFITAMVALSGMKNVKADKIPFTDITAESPYYNSVKTAYELSWISSADKFNPDSGITLVQAFKIGIHVLGGERQAAFYGGYPAGYIHLADSLDLSDNLSMQTDAPLMVRDAYILLYNIITSKTFTTGFQGDGNVSVSFGGTSILEKQFDLFVTEGILTANTITNLYNENEKGRASIKIGNEEFVDNKGITEYLGYNVKVLYKKDAGKKIAELVVPYETNVLKFDSSFISGIDNNTIYYGENEKKILLNPTLIYVLNGKKTILSGGELNTILNDESSVFTFIDNNNDRKYDVLSVLKYTYTYVNKYDLFDGIIYDVHSDTSLIDLSDDDCKYTVRNLKNGVFKDADISDVATDSVMACAVSADKTYADIVICSDKVQGKVEEITDDGKLIINGSEYKLSSYFNNYYTVKLGESGIYYLGIKGEIIVESGENDTSKYGFLIGVQKESGIGGKMLAKIFDQSDEFLVIEVEDYIRLDGNKKSSQDFCNFVSALGTSQERLIRYSLNSDGKIYMVDTSENKIDDFSSFGFDYVNDNSLALNYSGEFYARGSKIFVSTSQHLAKFNYTNTKYIFVVPGEDNLNDDEAYRIANPSEILIGYGNDLDLFAYNADETGSPETILTVGGYLNSADSISFATSYGVVTKVTDAKDDNDEDCYKIYLANSSSYSTIYLPYKVSNKYFVPNPGDIISYAVGVDGKIKFIVKAFDMLTYKVGASYSDEVSQLAFGCGFLYSAKGGYAHYIPAKMESDYKAVCPDTVDFSQLRNTNITASKTVYIDVVRSADGSVIKSVTVDSNPETKLKDIKTAGKARASFIVTRLNYSSNVETYVYNIKFE